MDPVSIHGAVFSARDCDRTLRPSKEKLAPACRFKRKFVLVFVFGSCPPGFQLMQIVSFWFLD